MLRQLTANLMARGQIPGVRFDSDRWTDEHGELQELSELEIEVYAYKDEMMFSIGCPDKS